jgi:hypothetical protein
MKISHKFALYSEYFMIALAAFIPLFVLISLVFIK